MNQKVGFSLHIFVKIKMFRLYLGVILKFKLIMFQFFLVLQSNPKQKGVVLFR
jgi:hypothetical protein